MPFFGLGMGTVRRISVLSEDECGLAARELRSLRPRWCGRRPGLPFFTLGAASYLDARSGAAAYASRAASDDPVLRERFGWIHARVASALAGLLDAPARLVPEHAAPGFHLYLSHPLFERPIAEVHFDRQQHRLDWGEEAEIDWGRPVSFTLPIALPRSGGGLHTWDVSFEEMAPLPREERRERFEASRSTYEPYRVGEMVVHSGHLLHQAAPGVHLVRDDERFTMQGHALHRDGVWELYW
jgi:hypothetical protein